MNYKLSDIQSVKAYANEIGGNKFHYIFDLEFREIEELLKILSDSWGGESIDQISYPYKLVINLKNGSSDTLDFRKNEILKNRKKFYTVNSSHPVTHFFSEFNFNNNILVRLLQFKNSKPTLDWIDRMWEGDTNFTPESILQVEPILDNYILELSKLTLITEENILKLVKECFEGLNLISNKYPGLIETLERGELVEFAEDGAKIAGIEIIDFDEKTNEWRAW